MSLATNFPTIRPSLSLDFANTKALDPRITFTRASTAKYYDGKTTVIAEQNLMTYSQDFDNAIWQKSGSATVTANSTTAPDGTTTADTVNGAVGSSYIIQGLTPTSGLTYTISVYAKANTTNFLQVAAGSTVFGVNVWANFDLSGGTVGSVGSSTTASIVSVGSGWYRCIITGAATATVTGNTFGIIPVESSTATRFPTNVGTTSIYAWGAQIEQRSVVTAYTATTTQAITNYIPALQTAAANVARFDCNPTTGESLRLLIEEARTNLYTYSDDFSNAAWTLLNSAITSNTIIAPDGTLSGDKVTASTAASYYVYRSTTANTYTLSMYMKAASSSTGGLYATGGVNCNAVFNLSTGVVTSVTNGTAAITSVGNGWYRCSVTYTTSSSGNSGFYLSTAAAGDSVYIWGAQLEAGSFATSYIPTVASTVTRAADVAAMTGTNFSSWYRTDAGTLYSEAICPLDSASIDRTIAFINDGTNSNGYVIRFAGATKNAQTYGSNAGAANQWVIQGGVSFVGANTKMVVGYAINDIAFVANTVLVGTDSLGISGPVTQLQIGAQSSANSILCGTIKKLAYYPARLTNTQLQALTS